MPRIIEMHVMGDPGQPLTPHEVATEEELLEFVNKGRAAGGADVLEALLPSTPQESDACLIANGLNFGCTVSPITEENRWYMWLPDNMSDEQAQVVAKALDCPLIWHELIWVEPKGYVNAVYRETPTSPSVLTRAKRGVELPVPIGNAALAFDEELAFTDFIKSEADYDDEDDCCDGECSC